MAEAQRENQGPMVSTFSFTRRAKDESLRIDPRMHLRKYEDVCNWLRDSLSGEA